MKIKVTYIFITGFVLSMILFNQSCKKNHPKPNPPIVAYKPNIYFFPEKEIDIYVELSFPQGGCVLESEPLYDQGWNVHIDTAGLINGRFEYLFYESVQPDVWQYDEAWCIHKDELPAFFEGNLAAYGFGEKEISDFIEYWIPLLNMSEYYLIYPQEINLIETVVTLYFSVKPDNILRLFYLIQETNEEIDTLIEPEIPEFSREGFFVTEWGVIR